MSKFDQNIKNSKTVEGVLEMRARSSRFLTIVEHLNDLQVSEVEAWVRETRERSD